MAHAERPIEGLNLYCQYLYLGRLKTVRGEVCRILTISAQSEDATSKRKREKKITLKA
jgi:hypothetical protein